MKSHRDKRGSSCDSALGKRRGEKRNRTALYKYKGDFQWQGVRDEPYKTENGSWSNIIRRVLIGSHGESAKFHVRYFEIEPEGCSSLETHGHEHAVLCVRGEGVVRTGRTKRTIRYMDVIYISPDTDHQFLNPFKKPFGFICIVNAKRDKPRLINR